MSIRYIIQTSVDHMEEIKNHGWWVRFKGSQELMFLGTERPPFLPGQRIRISIEEEPPRDPAQG